MISLKLSRALSANLINSTLYSISLTQMQVSGSIAASRLYTRLFFCTLIVGENCPLFFKTEVELWRA